MLSSLHEIIKNEHIKLSSCLQCSVTNKTNEVSTRDSRVTSRCSLREAAGDVRVFERGVLREKTSRSSWYGISAPLMWGLRVHFVP